MVRALQHSRDDVVFRHESFPCSRLAGAGFRPPLDPLRLSAGRATRAATGSDVPCRPPGLTPRLPPAAPCATTPPRERDHATIRARAVGTVRRLKLPARPTQNAFDWFDPNLATGNGCSNEQRSCTSQQPEHPFTTCSYPPVTVVGRHNSLLLIAPPPPRRTPTADQKKALLTNLCSRLVVNEYPRDPSIPEQPGSHRSDRPFGPFPATRTPVRALVQRPPRRRRLAVETASPTSNGSTLAVALASRDHEPRCPLGLPAPLSGRDMTGAWALSAPALAAHTGR
jgi:hypothetical protein